MSVRVWIGILELDLHVDIVIVKILLLIFMGFCLDDAFIIKSYFFFISFIRMRDFHVYFLFKV